LKEEKWFKTTSVIKITVMKHVKQIYGSKMDPDGINPVTPPGETSLTDF
jgi:hypothetical protein